MPKVAPLAGSVDRNIACPFLLAAQAMSLPSRGAWIEMQRARPLPQRSSSRSPRGERG